MCEISLAGGSLVSVGNKMRPKWLEGKKEGGVAQGEDGGVERRPFLMEHHSIKVTLVLILSSIRSQ